MQVINVARGGSMHADAGEHPGGDWDRWALVRASVLTGSAHPGHPDHELRVAPGSRLDAALGPGPHRVNSWHHQAIDRLGEGVEAVGRAEDGVVEAIEVAGDAWVLGVQWELQESWKEDERQAAIFRAFVSATARPSSARSSRMKRPAEGMCRRSPGACGPSIAGPKESIWRPGRFAPIRAVSRPPWVAPISGSLPNSSVWTRPAVASSGASGSGRQAG